MQFCDINEAWGNENFITEHYTNIQNNLKEHFSPVSQNLDLVSKTSKNENKNKTMTCKEIISHVMSCPQCSKQLKIKMFGIFYNNIRNTIENYREPITLVLITLFIILTINLIIKME